MSDRHCPNPPAFRYTWPGQDEKFICAIHGAAAVRVMQSMGMYLQLIPITIDDLTREPMPACSQKWTEGAE